MQLELILENDNLTISYDHDNHWLYVNWQGFHNQESSRQACLLILEVMRRRPAAKILNDNSNITHTTVYLTSWSLNWLQEMYAAGLRYLAWIYAPEFPERKSTDAIVQYIENPTVASFDDLATAYNWLRRQRVGT
ncbi:hypothetical protein [Hymenobacter metallilatus]|uniref:STAS/SEC14 domain-containing protein n=1 Tax=Hymenobacter metallilatus TaxID=2493666 RepID=A0A428JG93_9BACT|nr:hypothetical protein [Hymenobacter metallilatus]RSK31747.1 hypothetical protein EI290_13025 [Hymenobacter metallilatus]